MELDLADNLAENEAIFPTFNVTGAETFPIIPDLPLTVETRLLFVRMGLHPSTQLRRNATKRVAESEALLTKFEQGEVLQWRIRQPEGK